MTNRQQRINEGVLPTSHVSAPMPPVQPTRSPQGQADPPTTLPRPTPAPNQAPKSATRPPRR